LIFCFVKWLVSLPSKGDFLFNFTSLDRFIHLLFELWESEKSNTCLKWQIVSGSPPPQPQFKNAELYDLRFSV